MTIAKVVSDGYTTPKRLMDIKRISPLIVSMVRDGAIYYSLYVTAHLLRVLVVFTVHILLGCSVCSLLSNEVRS